MRLTVVLAVRGPREAALAAMLDRHPDIVVTRRCADLAEAVSALHAGLGMVVVVSEQPFLDRDVLAQLAGSGAAVVGSPSSVDAAEHLRALGIVHLVPPGADAVETAAAVLEASERGAPLPVASPEPETTPAEGFVVAVWGPSGAPGRTTVAVNVAAGLAVSGSRVICADADTYGGAVAHAFGLLDEAPGLAALARASVGGSLGVEVVDRYAAPVAPGLRVLGGITRAERWPELSGPALDPVWEELRAHAEITVIDCGFSLERDEPPGYDGHAAQRNAATLSALVAADVVVVVGRAEPLGIQRLVGALEELEEAVPGSAERRIVVVNRVRASVAGRRPERAVADALRRFAGVDEVWPLPEDGRACDAAALAGRTLREVRPRSAVTRALAGLAAEIGRHAPTLREPSASPDTLPQTRPVEAGVTD
ncbi:hypothetical protein [Demequina sp. NBRC 110054]|uniref:AAA family ATPase n=1 Tax=Demequina sp. NBRC 110054 TaxID=1570343 RepID=UPI000A06DD03|nr:hypothetical protein [Demequina sp. NBRC 110054]